MDITQIIIIVSLIAITAIIIVSGVFFIRLLKDLSVTLKKTNLILDDAHLITDSVAKPVSSFSEILMGFKNGFSFFSNLSKNKKNDE
jgi:FtsZ-interacting cell division protein ZipA